MRVGCGGCTSLSSMIGSICSRVDRSGFWSDVRINETVRWGSILVKIELWYIFGVLFHIVVRNSAMATSEKFDYSVVCNPTGAK